MIKIYTTDNCVYCKKAKVFFGEHNLPYKEINVQHDDKEREKLIALTGRTSVPVIEVNDQILVGFSESKLKEVLGIS